MARIDKYSGVTGGFRAPLAAAIAVADLGGVFAVGLDANGRVVRDVGATGYVGVIVPDKTLAAGIPIDVMTHGEVVEFTTGANGAANAAATAGSKFYGGATGALTKTAPSPAGTNGFLVGWTVEASRLIVRAQAVQL
jgi:hypothetical protein